MSVILRLSFTYTRSAGVQRLGHGRDMLPQAVCLWGGGESALQIRRDIRFGPFFRRLNLQRDRVTFVYSGSFAHGFVDPEPMAPLPIWFERSLKVKAIDGALNHYLAS